MCLTTAKPGWRTRLSQIPGAASEALGPQISAQECATRSVKSLFSGVLHQPGIHRQRPPCRCPGSGPPSALPPQGAAGRPPQSAGALGPQGHWPSRRLPVPGPVLSSVRLAVPPWWAAPVHSVHADFRTGLLCAGPCAWDVLANKTDLGPLPGEL